MAADALDMRPFPLLRWEDHFWVGEVTLPSWAGFQARRGWYGSVSSDRPSDGSARLTVAPENDDARTPPMPEQSAAFRRLLEDEAAIAAAVLRAIFERYPEEKEAYADAFDEGEAEALPDVRELGELRSLIGLSNVHVLSVVKDGAAYIGFEFGCVWDEEHGAGVMTHLGRVVAVGQADHSFVGWIAERDIEKSK